VDITREQFIGFWGESGYQQVFDAGYDYGKSISKILSETASGKTVLEIGCGNGFWTEKFLVDKFEQIITVDLIEKPAAIANCDKVKHIKLECADYSLPGVKSRSIDFVWSFGVFCHFTNAAIDEYLKSIYRVMKKGGTAIIMFANWERHPDFKGRAGVYGTDVEPFCGWTCTNLETTIDQVKRAGFIECRDIMEDFRDTLLIFKK